MTFHLLQGSADVEISDVVYHSDAAGPGSVFFCIKGNEADGHDYAGKAVSCGAAAVICEENLILPEQVTIVQVANVRKALAQISSNFYRQPWNELVTVAVTGTKGKTTTTYMVKKILEEAGYKTGLIGTIEVDTGKRKIESDHTTPEAPQIQAYLREMVDYGCSAAVIEVSSQALKLKRTDGITFDYGIFTNIEEDHIGPCEHRNFAEYAACKAKLFRQCKKGIVNGDDPNLPLILKGATCGIETFGMGEGCDLQGYGYSNIRMPGKLGVEICIKGSYNIELAIGISGKFTCYNALAAIGVCKSFCVNEEQIQKALREIRVPGRQEMFSVGNGGIILVDYAHNGTALRCILDALREYHPKRLTCVFGCGGQRDPGRRIQMARAAATFADFSIITSDNPRKEDPKEIIRQIGEEMQNCHGNYMIVPERDAAIAAAVGRCQNEEIVVIAGKGHENYQIIGEKKIHFDDREEVLKSIEKVNNERDYNQRN